MAPRSVYSVSIEQLIVLEAYDQLPLNVQPTAEFDIVVRDVNIVPDFVVGEAQAAVGFCDTALANFVPFAELNELVTGLTGPYHWSGRQVCSLGLAYPVICFTCNPGPYYLTVSGYKLALP